jgi:hypothetical protein
VIDLLAILVLLLFSIKIMLTARQKIRVQKLLNQSKMKGAVWSEMLGSVCSEIRGSVSREEMGSVYAKFPTWSWID